jgi:hypothetical protein
MKINIENPRNLNDQEYKDRLIKKLRWLADHLETSEKDFNEYLGLIDGFSSNPYLVITIKL